MAAIGKTVVAQMAVAGTAVPLLAGGLPTSCTQIVVKAQGTGPVYLGDSTVTATGATKGLPIGITDVPLYLECNGFDLGQLYINSASATDSLVVLYFRTV